MKRFISPSPRDVASPAPLLGWRVGSVRQTAYQLRVADESTELWNSGKVTSAASTNVPYGGPPLAPAASYVFSVRTWSGAAVSAWSPPARFGTAAGPVWGDTKPTWACTGGAETATTWPDYTVTLTNQLNVVAGDVHVRGD